MMGTFRLDPGQALVLDIEPPDTRYWNVTLENIWHECLEPRRRHSSVTNRAVRPDADGRVRIAISAEDLGFGHWLDTGGRHRGFVVLRWLDNPDPPDVTVSVRRARGAGMTLQERFTPERLIAAACEEAGSDDFGADGWQTGLDRLTDGLINEARLSAIGVEIAYLDIMRALKNRLGVIAWRKQHPEIATKPITQPIVIVGQPRTGTTILYDLLAQDPDLRAPLTWEVDEPCPVPQPETYHDDPRIAQVQASIEMSEQIIPGFLAFHPMGALVGQECVRITASEFTSMIFTVQYRLPSYYRWLLYDADHAGAYRYPPNLPAAPAIRRSRPVAAEIAGAPVAAGRAARRIPRRLDRADAPRPAQRHLVDRRADPPPATDGQRRIEHRRVRGPVL